jgi:hypothetical protein
MHFEDYLHKGRLSEEEILLFLQKRLSEQDMERVQEVIHNSKEDFQTYMTLLEADFLLKTEPRVTTDFSKKIKELAKSKASKPYIQLFLRFLEDKVMISSSDQEDLEYRGIMADFALRGSSPGPISITRTIDGREVVLSFTPSVDNKGYLVQTKLDNAQDLSCIMVVDEEEWEVNRNLVDKKNFDSIVPLNCHVELQFKGKGELEFTIAVRLNSNI